MPNQSDIVTSRGVRPLVPDRPPVYTTGEIAKICKVAPKTVVGWFDSGDLEGYKIPGSADRRVPLDALNRFLVAKGIQPVGEDQDNVWVRTHRAWCVGLTAEVGFLVSQAVPYTFAVHQVQTVQQAARLTTLLQPSLVVIDFFVGMEAAVQTAKDVRDVHGAGPQIVGVTGDVDRPDSLGAFSAFTTYQSGELRAVVAEAVARITKQKGE